MVLRPLLLYKDAPLADTVASKSPDLITQTVHQPYTGLPGYWQRRNRLLRNSDANQGTAVEEGDGVDLIFCFSIPRRKTRPRRLQLPPSSTCALDICDSFLLSPVPGATR